MLGREQHHLDEEDPPRRRKPDEGDDAHGEEGAAALRLARARHFHELFGEDRGPVPSEARVDLKALPAAIGSKRVSFGKAEDMDRLLGIAPGSVTPLAAINAPAGSMTVVLDAGLAAADTVNVHPLRNTGTLGLSGAAILDLLRHWGHAPVVAPIPVQAG